MTIAMKFMNSETRLPYQVTKFEYAIAFVVTRK